jgi:hypothetical protein
MSASEHRNPAYPCYRIATWRLSQAGGAQSLHRRAGRPFLNVVELDCLCDEAAIQAAKRNAVGHSVELWSGTRSIRLLHHEPD